MTDRVLIKDGNFFESVPEGGDAYLLSHIIHDWSEEQRLSILGNCRRAMNPGGRLLIIEMVLPAGDSAAPRQDARYDDACGAGRTRADGTGIWHVARQGGSASYASCAHRITRERRRSLSRCLTIGPAGCRLTNFSKPPAQVALRL